ncbi:MAG: hypothetical protein JJT78_13860 [Leptospira sp.]|nr:hypothetical protein [Leptospira sp.]
MLGIKFNPGIAYLIGLLIFFNDCRFILKPRIPKEFSDSIEKIELSHKGMDRSYLIQYPKSNKKKPLLLVFHGGAGTPEGMMALDRNELLNSSKVIDFAIAYLKGEGNSWNDGRITETTTAHKKSHDDVGYTLKVIQDISKKYSIDEKQIHAVGISNGGMFSLRLACEVGEKFASITSITANMPKDLSGICPAKFSTNLTIMNGTDDPLVPYNGGDIKIFGRSHGTVLSTDETIEFFQNKWNCNPSTNTKFLPKQDPQDSTKIQIASISCGSKVIKLFKIINGGHTWPGGIQYLPERRIGKVTQHLNASEYVADFVVKISN